MRVIFMGCSDFGVPALKKINENFNLVAVFTSMPKPQNRKMQLVKSIIHQETENLNLIKNDQDKIQIVNVKTMRGQEIYDRLNAIEADIIVVVSYGFILTKDVLEMKKYGCINLHPSDLPELRGPAPLQYSILNQLEKTKICVIKMDEGIDTGDILKSIDLDIPKNTSYVELSKICAELGASLLCDTLININKITPISQNSLSRQATYTKKIKKEDGLLNLCDDVELIYAKFLTYKEWPSLYFLFQDKIHKICEMSIEKTSHNDNIGHILISKQKNNNYMKIAVKGGYINILKIKPANKSEMLIKDFLNNPFIIASELKLESSVD